MSSYDIQVNDNDENMRRTSSQRRQVISPNSTRGQLQTGPDRAINSRQGQLYTNGGTFSASKTDLEHQAHLYEHLSMDLGHLLNRTDISDCFLNVRGTFMAVHKCILAARSNAFAAIISGTINRLGEDERNQIEVMTDKDKLILKIDKTDPEIMKHVIIFMYTGKCELDESNAYDLLDAAGRYDIKDLKAHTGRFLSSRIDSNNVLLLLNAAYRYNNTLIKHRCIEYFINNAKEVMDIHEPWKKFAEEQQPIVAELLHWLVNKDHFYSSKPQHESKSQWY
ncbi:unnamed protein product [Rotaria sp. Silwood1]|nr:unnamed protein product [Rotaria sp. Silwood1]CAF1263690.1 unnamed protein product [Rotaria sp. Silwood1]CAF3490119.1 unnamed protein product [Rotaria sp. Silwood1]CAF3497528.1 unnamed protein product [Rotaria sp. Silwood1]CAF4950325.1 unnamed protein product [Rotaria sp. Silwood1]